MLNTAPHYVETIAKVKDVFANRYELDLTVADARTLAKKLFTIADERDEAIRRTGRYANDAFFAPKALRWLDEQETELLDGLKKTQIQTVEIHGIMGKIQTSPKERLNELRMPTSTMRRQRSKYWFPNEDERIYHEKPGVFPDGVFTQIDEGWYIVEETSSR